jgi:hypothetical protein
LTPRVVALALFGYIGIVAAVILRFATTSDLAAVAFLAGFGCLTLASRLDTL